MKPLESTDSSCSDAERRQTPPSALIADPIAHTDPRLLQEGFASDTRKLLIERTRFMVRVGAPIYLAFWLLDLTVIPQHAGIFLVLRLVTVTFAALAAALTYTRWGERHVNPLSMGVIYVCAAVIAVMTVLAGGFGSNYYIGIMLVVFVAGFFIPWRPSTMIWVGAAVLGTYLSVNFAVFGRPQLPQALSTGFFLGSTWVLAVFAAAADSKKRLRDLALRLQLERANRELRALDDAKTRFFANVSHELRTPLMLVLGPIDELLAAKRDPSERSILESIRANARRLLRQVNAILDVTKIEAGRLDLNLGAGNLGRQLADFVVAAQPHAAARRLRLETEGLEGLPDTFFDAEKMEIVAANLLSNALKFTPAGGRVLVRASADKGRIRFEVEDTGPGISPEHLDHVFERFYQVDSSAAREHEGTGLGLALSRELVRLHSGMITVSSRVSHGSTFSVELPRDPKPTSERRRGFRRHEDRLTVARQASLVAGRYEPHSPAAYLMADVASAVPEPAAAVGGSAAPGESASPAGAAAILVVEDNADLRRFLSRALEKEYRVYTASDGVEGLHAVRRVHPDLILADVMMPRLDGHGLCRQLRVDPVTAAVPIIMLTARAGTDAAIEGLAAGADDYIAKPFDIRELKARIRAHLRARALECRLDERETRLLAIGGMTAAIAHDLKNPLTAITLLTDMALRRVSEGADAKTLVPDLKALSSETDRLGRMLVELLDFARAGATGISRKPTAVREFLERIMQQPQRLLHESGVNLVMDLEGVGSTKAPIDAERLHRVIENLVTNAREAVMGRRLSAAQPCVWLRATVRDDELVIRIADNGPGIPEEMRPKLFQPFASANKAHGVGLGLVMARSLARAHDGEVEVEPRAPEGGAAFTLRLPCPRSQAAAVS